MEHTSNYNLSQWAGEDRILREDFNADNAKIEAALAQEAAARAAADTNLQNNMNAAIAAAGNCKIVTGSYVGSGKYDADNPNTLSFNFQPLMVLLDVGTMSNYNSIPQYYILLCPATTGFSKGSGEKLNVTWSTKGVSWYSPNTTYGPQYQFNIANQTYHYIAIGI